MDVDPRTHTIDPTRIGAAISLMTKAIVPVHLYGRLVDMSAILAIPQEHGLRVVEDACQAHGAEGRLGRAGGIGDVAAFSFYMSKKLGAYSEAGAVTMRDQQIAERVRRLRNHGSMRRYEHLEVDANARLDELQAAVLRVKLRPLETWHHRRRVDAARYHEALEELSVVLPAASGRPDHVYHLYVIQVPAAARDDIQQTLCACHIATAIHYPIHQQPAMRSAVYGCGDMLETEAFAPRIRSLPMYPELDDAQIRHVSGMLREALPRPVQVISVQS